MWPGLRQSGGVREAGPSQLGPGRLARGLAPSFIPVPCLDGLLPPLLPEQTWVEAPGVREAGEQGLPGRVAGNAYCLHAVTTPRGPLPCPHQPARGGPATSAIIGSWCPLLTLPAMGCIFIKDERKVPHLSIALREELPSGCSWEPRGPPPPPPDHHWCWAGPGGLTHPPAHPPASPGAGICPLDRSS